MENVKANTKCGHEAQIHPGAVGKPHRGCKVKNCRWGK